MVMEKLSSGKDGNWKFRKLYNKAWPFYQKRYELCLLYHRTGISDPRGLYRPNVCTWLKLFRSINVYRMSLQLASAWLATFHGCSIQSPECPETSKDNFLVKMHIHTLYIYTINIIFLHDTLKMQKNTSYLYFKVYWKQSVFLLQINAHLCTHADEQAK